MSGPSRVLSREPRTCSERKLPRRLWELQHNTADSSAP